MYPVHDRGSMDPVQESGPWTRSKVGVRTKTIGPDQVHGPIKISIMCICNAACMTLKIAVLCGLHCIFFV